MPRRQFYQGHLFRQLMNDYFLHRSANREQELRHVQSSVEELTLENIQAQREALRKRNIYLSYELQRSGFTPSEQYLDIVDELQPNKQLKQSVVREISYSSKENPWATKERAKQRSEVKEGPERQKVAVQFRQYQEAKRLKELAKLADGQAPDFERFQCTSPNEDRRHLPNQTRLRVESLSKSQESRGSDKSKDYETKLIDRLYLQLQKGGMVGKADFIDFLQSKPQVLKLFRLTVSELKTNTVKYNTANYGSFSKEEFSAFLKMACESVAERHQELQSQEAEIRKSKEGSEDQNEQLLKKGCLIKRGDMKMLEEIFRELDKFNDMVVSRVKLVERLRSDPRVDHLMELQAVHEFKIDKSISFSRILQRILVEGGAGSQEDRRAKEFVSLKQFLAHFFSCEEVSKQHQARLNYLSVLENIGTDDEDQIELPRIAYDMLQRAYDCSRHVGPYVLTTQFVQNIKRSEQYFQLRNIAARKASQMYRLEGEDFEDVLQRMLKEGEQYMDLNQIFQYFSKKGRPIEHYQEQMRARHKNKEDLQRQIEQEAKRRREQPDGYDSDPEEHYRQRRKPILAGETVQSKNFDSIKEAINYKRSVSATNTRPLKDQRPLGFITIPEPFSFQALGKAKQQQRKKSKSKQRQQQQYKFKTKPIPAKVLEVGLLDKLNQQHEQRKAELKRQSMAITLANERPFSFYQRQKKAKKKNAQQRKQFVFKAKPIPWFCSVNLYKKMQEEQNLIRKQKISRMAQEGMTKSRLPPRMEKDEQLKKAKQLREGGDYTQRQQTHQHQSAKRKPVPDFAKIHKALTQSLERKRNSKRPTEPAPFQFEQSKRNNNFKEQLPQKEGPVTHAATIDEVRRKMHRQPTFKAASTLKFQEAMKKTREDRIANEAKRNERLEVSHKQDQALVEKIRSSLNKVDDWDARNKQQVKKRQEQLKAKAENYKRSVREMYKKIEERPRLVEQSYQRDQKLEQMRRLYQMYKLMKGNKVNPKHISNAFTKDEFKLVLDYEYLLKKQLVKSE